MDFDYRGEIVIDLLFMAAVMLTMILLPSILALRGFHQRGRYLIKRKVGPTYWGVYSWANATDARNELLIDLPQPSRYSDHAYGSGRYASGKAVKSARG